MDKLTAVKFIYSADIWVHFNEMDNQVTYDKRTLILQYVAPSMGINTTDNERLIEELIAHCHLHTVIKLQLIEIPGDWQDGRIWFSINAMSHCYYNHPQAQLKCGRQIWKKQEFIFDSYSFYEQQPRSDYIQAIEPGTFISISYPVLHWLQERFPVIKERLIRLSRCQQAYYRDHVQLLNNPALQKVMLFITLHKLFSSVASNAINSMHVGLTRQNYEVQLKNLK